MTERQMHICRILADPVSTRHDLYEADREAVAAALAEVGRLRRLCGEAHDAMAECADAGRETPIMTRLREASGGGG